MYFLQIKETLLRITTVYHGAAALTVAVLCLAGSLRAILRLALESFGQTEARDKAERAASAPKAVDEEVNPEDDALYGLRVHCWVLVLPTKRGVPEPFFIGTVSLSLSFFFFLFLLSLVSPLSFCRTYVARVLLHATHSTCAWRSL